MKNALQDELLEKIKELENRVEAALEEGKKKFSYDIEKGKAVFDKSIVKLHKQVSKNLFLYIVRAPFKMFVVAPFIYVMIVPAVILDLFITLYQMICFSLCNIKKVKRSDYIIFDRHRLQYLNALERFNCLFCSYVNGLLSYCVEIGARTEQYFCPIKHTKRLAQNHKHYKYFLEYGDYKGYQERLESLRKRLEPTKTEESLKKD